MTQKISISLLTFFFNAHHEILKVLRISYIDFSPIFSLRSLFLIKALYLKKGLFIILRLFLLFSILCFVDEQNIPIPLKRHSSFFGVISL